MNKTLTRASGSPGYMNCLGKLRMTKFRPDVPNEFAAEGTVAHLIAEKCFSERVDASTFVGQTFESDGFKFTVDDEMADFIQVYVDSIRQTVNGRRYYIEETMDFSHLTGFEPSKLTVDCLIVGDGLIEVHDLKFGRKPVEYTEQLDVYGLTALHQYGDLFGIDKVKMVIHQPRLRKIFSWTKTAEELEDFGKKLFDACQQAVALYHEDDEAAAYPYLTPGDRQCAYCTAKASCPALENKVSTLITDDELDELDEITPVEKTTAKLYQLSNERLGFLLSNWGLVDAWKKALDAEIEKRLLQGQQVPGFKLIEAVGNKTWINEAEAIEALKSMRVKDSDIFKLKLKTPNQIEALLKKQIIGPRQWQKLEQLTHRKSKGASVALETDKGQPFKPVSVDELDSIDAKE